MVSFVNDLHFLGLVNNNDSYRYLLKKFVIGLIIVIGILVSGILYAIFVSEQDNTVNTDKLNQERIEETEEEIVIHESVLPTSNEDICIGDCP